MKTATATRTVTTFAGESNAFTIKANGKAFKVLIDGLYANKIQSITREIWSNALDAHVMAGCPERPFDVSFPSVFDPTFRVRDYGVSLTHDEVMKLYTTVFESTKEDTNAQVGKLGLGSKSPFAYTDTFSVTVVLDGEKRFYAAMIGEDGIPTIHFMAVEGTEEENGVEVSFPVHKGDVSRFREAAQRVSHGFDVKPVVPNDPHFSGWQELPVAAEGDGWRLLRGSPDGYSARAYAKQGCVLYPINANAVDGLDQHGRDLLEHTFVIDFPIGSLEITASREELSYGRNEPTSASICASLSNIVKELTTSVLESYAECPTYWDACAKFKQDLHGRLPHSVNKLIKEQAVWRGEPLQTALGWRNHTHGISIASISGAKLRNQYYRFNEDGGLAFIPSDNTVFVVEDLTLPKSVKRVGARIQKMWANSSTKPEQIVWVRYRGGREAADAMIKLTVLVDGARMVMAEDLEEAPAPVRSQGRVRVKVLRNYTFYVGPALSAEDLAEGGVYVPLENGDPNIPLGMGAPHSVRTALVQCGALSESTPVYGAPKTLWRKFAGDHWVNLYDLATKTFEDNCADQPFSLRNAVKSVTEHALLSFAVKHVDASILPAHSAMGEAAEFRADVLAQPLKDVAKWAVLAQAVGRGDVVNVDDHPLLDDLNQHEEALREAYPMLDLLAQHARFANNLLDRVTEYVIMCDTAHAANQSTRIAA